MAYEGDHNYFICHINIIILLCFRRCVFNNYLNNISLASQCKDEWFLQALK